MFDVDTTLFLWLNASSTSPSWMVPLARFASIEMPQLLIAGSIGACMVGDAGVRRVLIRAVLAMLIAWVIARVAQNLWPMPRPFVVGLGTAWLTHAASSGFPSTHASVASAFATAVALLSHHRLAGGAAVLAAALIAWSRVSLGLHFPFDVLTGVVVGIFSAWVSGVIPHVVSLAGRAHE